MEDEKVSACRKVGIDLAEACKDPENAKYVGDAGVCPHCHTKEFYIHQDGTAECVVCGMIFYFSGTGNSKYAARKLSEDVGGKLVNMADAVNSGEYSYTLEEGEDAGIVFPVYFNGIPAAVRKFLSRVVLGGARNPYVYAVVT